MAINNMIDINKVTRIPVSGSAMLTFKSLIELMILQ